MVYRPVKELKGFVKAEVKAGEKKGEEVILEKSAFAYWSSAKDCWTVDDGVYEILIGTSSQDIRLAGKLTIENGKIAVI